MFRRQWLEAPPYKGSQKDSQDLSYSIRMVWKAYGRLLACIGLLTVYVLWGCLSVQGFGYLGPSWASLRTLYLEAVYERIGVGR